MTSRTFKITTANTTNLTQVSGGPSVVRGASLVNTTDDPYYVKLYWFQPTQSVPAPTVGTTVPNLTIAVPPLDPASGADGTICPSWPEGVTGSGQLFMAVTGAASDTDTTAVASGQGVISLLVDGP